MSTAIRILNLEDNPSDATLVRHLLRAEWPDCEVIQVSGRREFVNQLMKDHFKLILSDNSLPDFDGLSALKLAREIAADVPFIFVSGTLGEEVAIESLRSGATDYVLKHHLNALIPAVHRALREAEERKRRHHAETTLRRREEYYRALTENSLDIVTILSADGKFSYNSPSAERLLGYKPDELFGRVAFELIHPEDVARARGALAECVEFPGRVVRIEFRFCHKDGSFRHLESVGRSLLEHPEIAGIVINSRDVTERKELEARFLRTQRLETIGVLASGITHDLNNALVPIVMGVGLLRPGVRDENSRRMLDLMEGSAKRAGEMVRQVLAFARGVEGARTKIAVQNLIKEVGKIITDTFPKKIRVQAKIPDGLWTVSGELTQLHQVLMNLSVNARDAMPNGGQLILSAENLTVDELLAASLPNAKPGPYVVIGIEDTGTGIAAGNIARIFEPFFTTKELGKGTGLGLSTSLEIVRNHEGIVTVRSEVDRGSTFSIYLPALNGVSADVVKEETAVPPMGHDELILLAEDEESIREITKSTLEAYGYRVIVAGDGAEAVGLFAQHAKEISLVLTDLSMPYMDGPTAIRAILKIDPAIKIMAASGLGSHREEEEAKKSGVKAFLRKPYSAGQLLTTLDEVLQSR